MTLFQKLLLACVYVLGSDNPIDISFEHGNHRYHIYNYVETSSLGIDVGVDFDVDDDYYNDLWWEIRRNGKVNYKRLNEAISHIAASFEN